MFNYTILNVQTRLYKLVIGLLCILLVLTTGGLVDSTVYAQTPSQTELSPSFLYSSDSDTLPPKILKGIRYFDQHLYDNASFELERVDVSSLGDSCSHTHLLYNKYFALAAIHSGQNAEGNLIFKRGAVV